ncbi:glycerate kinase [Faecalimonas canis]
MNVAVIMDSFKGSMTSQEAGNAVRKGIKYVYPNANVSVKPLADGGEGTGKILTESLGGKEISVFVSGPLGEKMEAYYGYIEKEKVAIIEMAQAAGLTLLKEKNPLQADTFGVGEMILDAMQKGCREFWIGIGGSGTNDAGVGMLRALGYLFLDKEGKQIGHGGKEVGKIESISDENVSSLLKKCRFRIMCDVENELYGKNGATYVFGKQKGVTEEQKEKLDKGIEHFAYQTEKFIGKDYSLQKGAGTGGGIGFAFLSYLQAEFSSGIQFVMDKLSIEEIIQKADIVITGEGRLDVQTGMGKAPLGVAKLAKRYHKNVIAFAGTVTEGAKLCNEKGIDAFFPIVREILTLEEATEKEKAIKNLEDSVEQVFRVIQMKGGDV